MTIEELKSSRWFSLLVITSYLSAIVLANYLITVFGQAALPWVAFSLIPFDLIARDLMQDRWQGERVFRKMVWLIFAGAVISWTTGTGSLKINIASLSAFIIAGAIDALTYQWMIRRGRVFRINAATLTAAITDSIIFVTIAFSAINWRLVCLQIAMKLAGGLVWSLLLYRFFSKKEVGLSILAGTPIIQLECIPPNEAYFGDLSRPETMVKIKFDK